MLPFSISSDQRTLPRDAALTASLFIALITLLYAAGAGAHARSVSYSHWKLGETRHSVQVRVSQLELSRLGLDFSQLQKDSAPVADYLAERLVLRAGDSICTRTTSPRPRRAREGWLAFGWAVECSQSGPLSIESRILLDSAPSHLHFARVHFGRSDGEASEGDREKPIRSQEKVLTKSESRWELGPLSEDAAAEDRSTAGSTSGSTTGEYVALGIEHILSGWDHLAFVFALLLLAGSLGEVARLVTGFTLAHSVTLALAALGVLHPDGPAVEAVIGFSVALVAAENGWELSGRARAVPIAVGLGLTSLMILSLAGIGTLSVLTLIGLLLFSLCHFGLLGRVENPAGIRTALAFCFGLVHGFGFAGVLEEIALPTDRMVSALFGFNVGVEIGQLAVVLVAWPTLRWIFRWRGAGAHRLVSEWGSAAICGLGLFWFTMRAI